LSRGKERFHMIEGEFFVGEKKKKGPEKRKLVKGGIRNSVGKGGPWSRGYSLRPEAKAPKWGQRAETVS